MQADDQDATAKAAIKLFFTTADRLDEFVDACCTGGEPWQTVLDVEGRFLAVAPEGTTWSVRPSAGSPVEGDGPIALVRHARLLDLLDPDMEGEGNVIGGFATPADAFEAFIEHAEIVELQETAAPAPR